MKFVKKRGKHLVFNMSPGKSNIIPISHSEESCSRTQCYDPLEGLGDAVHETTFYRVDSVVFAEPLNISNIYKTDKHLESMDDFKSEELIVHENVTVRKRHGKVKKLYVDLHDDTNLTCTMQNCNKNFSSSILLKAHIRKVHFSEKRFMCEVCGAGFSARYLLKRHSAVHGSKKVQCPVCLKMLSLRTKFSEHVRAHAGPRTARRRQRARATEKTSGRTDQ